jgi:hypothetical protein
VFIIAIRLSGLGTVLEEKDEEVEFIDETIKRKRKGDISCVLKICF